MGNLTNFAGITPEQVWEAYAKTGFKPANHMWADEYNGECYACALSALVCAADMKYFEEFRKCDDYTLNLQMIEEVTGLPKPYANGIVHGYDSNRESLVPVYIPFQYNGAEEMALFRSGYQVGVKAAQLIKPDREVKDRIASAKEEAEAEAEEEDDE